MTRLALINLCRFWRIVVRFCVAAVRAFNLKTSHERHKVTAAAMM